MSRNDLHFSLKMGLHPKDSDQQTYGCRHTNPDICRFCDMPEICAFANEDHICRKPSASWKKFYEKLKQL